MKKKAIGIILVMILLVGNCSVAIAAEDNIDSLITIYAGEIITIQAGETYEIINNTEERAILHSEKIGNMQCACFDFAGHLEYEYVNFAVTPGDFSNIYISAKGKFVITNTSSDGSVTQLRAWHDGLTARKIQIPVTASGLISDGETGEIRNNADEGRTLWIWNSILGGASKEDKLDYFIYDSNNQLISSQQNVSIDQYYEYAGEIPAKGRALLIVSTVEGEGRLGVGGSSLSININESTKQAIYIYDEPDSGASVVLPIDKLAGVTDKASAVSAIQSITSDMTAEQKQSATGIDLATLFAEEAVAQAASDAVGGSEIVINQDNVASIQGNSLETKSAVEAALASGGIVQAREMNADIKLKTDETKSVKITIDPSAVSLTADNVRVETPDYSVTLSSELIKTNAKDSPLVITITENSPTTGLFSDFTLNELMGSLDGPLFDAVTSGTKYNITFNKPVTENVKVSVNPAQGDPKYQAVTNSKGDAVGGKYNPATGKLEVKIKDSDTYTVKENKKDFTDISNKSNEMQEAIKILSSKGIINGTSATQFSPDGSITRAEIAALIVRTLSKYDSKANGHFDDVQPADWYCAAVGSAKQYGIINGLSATTFGPKNNIQKDQIVAIAARTLKAEMKYRDVSDTAKYLSTYTDQANIPSWAYSDISLATRENLVLKRTDGSFGASATMSRGDAAIILYRMFNKVW